MGVLGQLVFAKLTFLSVTTEGCPGLEERLERCCLGPSSVGAILPYGRPPSKGGFGLVLLRFLSSSVSGCGEVENPVGEGMAEFPQEAENKLGTGCSLHRYAPATRFRSAASS